MNTEALLRKHLAAAAEATVVTPGASGSVKAAVRRSRLTLGLAMAAVLVAFVAVAGALMTGSDDVIAPSSTIPPTTAPQVIETTTTTFPQTTTSPLETTSTTNAAAATTTSLPEGEVTVAWTAATAEGDVDNYLAALAAGAYEVAAWPLENNGAAFDGQGPNETPAGYLERVCEGGRCAGPYQVAAEGPGLVDPLSAQASSAVVVTHVDSGEKSVIEVATFEGQKMVLGIPPLVPSNGEDGLVGQLFGSDTPDRIVVQRLDAFEIWEDGVPAWVTNWWADDTYGVEGDFAITPTTAVDVRDPSATWRVECGELMSRDATVLVLERCFSNEWRYSEVESGVEVAVPIDTTERGDGESAWFQERGGTVVSGVGDAEGNLFEFQSDSGVDLAADDYIGYVKVSADGSKVAYVDHRNYNHFWSPVVVVKDVATGTEMNRWVLDGPVGGLEFSGDWVVATELTGDIQALSNGDFGQVAVDAINIVTGTVNRVETGTRVFLPS